MLIEFLKNFLKRFNNDKILVWYFIIEWLKIVVEKWLYIVYKY